MTKLLLRRCALWGLVLGPLVGCSGSSLGIGAPAADGGRLLDASHDTSAGACWSPSDCNYSSFGSSCVFPGETACGACIIAMNPCTSDSDCVGDGAVPRICTTQPCVCGGTGLWCTDGCTQDSDCGAGQTCRADHHCGAIACGAQGQACPTDFTCGSGGTCVRLTCTRDTECSNACVEGQCYASPGRCQNHIP